MEPNPDDEIEERIRLIKSNVSSDIDGNIIDEFYSGVNNADNTIVEDLLELEGIDIFGEEKERDFVDSAIREEILKLNDKFILIM